MQVNPDDDELIIPIKRWRVFLRSLYSFSVLAIVCAAGTFAFLTEPLRTLHVGWMILAIAFYLLFVVGAGMLAYNDLHSLRSRSLRLDTTGFELGTDRWAWKDLSAVERVEQWDGEDRVIRILVRFHAGRGAGATSSLTPINPPDFDTGDQPLEDILRAWLMRFRAPPQ